MTLIKYISSLNGDHSHRQEVISYLQLYKLSWNEEISFR